MLLVVASMAAPGGAERVMADMASYWARQGRDVAVATFDDAPDSWFYPLDERVRRVPLGGLRESRGVFDALVANISRIRRLRRAIRRQRPHAVISFCDATNILAIAASLGAGTRVVVSERSMPAASPLKGPWRLLRRLLYPLADSIVVQSRAAAGFFNGPERPKVVVIPNAVSPPAAVRERAKAGAGTVMAAGRFTAEKRFDLLIDAFAGSAAARAGWSLVIYGEGPLRSSLEERIRSHDPGARIHLPGTTTRLGEELARADLFVLSSSYEGFPNVLCEAMAAGVPVVATSCPGGVADIVRPSIDGMIVPVGDVAAMRTAIDALAGDPAERDRLGRNAREITGRFRVELVMNEWDRILHEEGAAG
ncbi:MAG TPA: glycosyltransferase family 4 protein [Thermoanaerobaculia bacterium]